jgi:anti-sigma B factor antagonist
MERQLSSGEEFGMSGSGLVISKVMDVTVATLHVPSLLDEQAIENIGKGLYELVDEQAIRKLVVDFRHVAALSSQMLGVLVSLNKRARAIKGKVVLCGMRHSLMKIFQVTRLDKIMAFAPDESAAVQML